MLFFEHHELCVDQLAIVLCKLQPALKPKEEFQSTKPAEGLNSKQKRKKKADKILALHILRDSTRPYDLIRLMRTRYCV
jgi:hypothetical protein